jgi:hypothetical protein
VVGSHACFRFGLFRLADKRLVVIGRMVTDLAGQGRSVMALQWSVAALSPVGRNLSGMIRLMTVK